LLLFSPRYDTARLVLADLLRESDDAVSVRIGGVSGVFMWGMLYDLCVPLADWYTPAPAALTNWPLTGGPITDVPGLTFSIYPTATGWHLNASVQLHRRLVPTSSGGVVYPAFGPLIEEAGEAETCDLLPDRGALIAGLAAKSAEQVAALQEKLGYRWPSPSSRWN
jgi:hypothetical protein